MRKSNWIIYIIALVISAFLLWLWYHLHFNHVDAPLDLVLSIIWWVGVAAACWGIYRVEKKRRQRVRTCYIAPELLYNSEAGTSSLKDADAEATVERIHDLLKDLEYGFDIQDRPLEDREKNIPVPFLYVVRSEVFKVEREEDREAGTPEKLDWQGEVAEVASPDDAPFAFSSREELQAIMGRLMTAPSPVVSGTA